MKVVIELDNVHPLHARDRLLEAAKDLERLVLNSTAQKPLPKFGKLMWGSTVIASYEITYSFAWPEKLP